MRAERRARPEGDGVQAHHPVVEEVGLDHAARTHGGAVADPDEVRLGEPVRLAPHAAADPRPHRPQPPDERGRARGGVAGVNILEDPPIYRSGSPKNQGEFNLDKANALLDDAGWKKNGQYREKGGKQMSVVFLTTVNTVRQKTQQICKDGWEKVGIKTELKSVDSTIFFSSDAGNPDTSGHMYVDFQMYTTSAAFDPQAHMKRWTSAAAKLSQKEGKWSGGNDGRYVNPEYDKLWDAALSELDPQKRAQLFIQMNDILIQDVAMIPLVNRKSVFGRAKNLQNTLYSQWAGDYWNIANWVKS